MKKSQLIALLGSAASLIFASDTVAAQSAPPSQAESGAPSGGGDEEIVVTGTQIRGIAPPGSTVVGLSADEMQATGATNAAQLIANIPQSATFGNLTATLPGGGTAAGISRVPIARPNLRSLPGCSGSVSGACTLVLFDGRRLVPSGVEQTAVDPSVIPPGILGRVETILDGNSAIYGSDAIGGVINFIPAKGFSGVKADARYGTGDAYNSFDANITGGLAWDTGSFTASYSYGHNSALFNRDRDYVTSKDFSTGGIAQRITGNYSCINPTIRVGTAFFRAQDLSSGQNTCDVGDDGTYYPEITRNTVFGAFEQSLGGSLTFKLDGLYSDYK